MKAVKVNLGKVSITVNGIWEDKDYDKLSLVYHEERNASYISKRPVPKGTLISDTKYWTLIVQGGFSNEVVKDIYTKSEIDQLFVVSIETIKQYIEEKLINYYTKEEIDNAISNIDLSNYYNKEEINNKLKEYATKEDLDNIIIEGGDINIDLTSYVKKVDLERDYAKKSEIPIIPNFKTINGQSIIGTGNIVINGSSSGSSGGSSGGDSGGSSGGGSTTVDVNYTPTLDESTKITTEIGSIKAGSILGELAGKSYSEIIDAMLVNETYNDPGYTHNISLGNVNTLVKVGSSVIVPTITAIWNTNIQSNSNKVITNNLTKTILGSSETVYNKSGNSTFVLTYSYPEGYYDIVSNLGNTKRIIVRGKTNATISKIVTATYPWFINTIEQALVAIGNSKTIEVELTGSPSIKVPFTNSTVTIQADLGFGWMDVDWNVSIDNSNLGGAIDETVPYKVYSKPDSYASSVKHRIIINLKK